MGKSEFVFVIALYYDSNPRSWGDTAAVGLQSGEELRFKPTDVGDTRRAR